jgi:uroporphyrinogen-III decarboxylase
MVIGPFSLTTKLLADPITPIALALSGVSAEDDAGVAAVKLCRRMAQAAVERSVRAQIAAGAKAILVCEPAANIVYLSPRQLKSNPWAFEEYVLAPNLKIKGLMDEAGVDLIFHDCGELNDGMVEAFGRVLHPSMLSLGASRVLWEDARLIPGDVTLFGNMPTKMFYSDSVMPADEVRERTKTLAGRMAECGHPHVLGSECDVLYVEGSAETILEKVGILLNEGAA